MADFATRLRELRKSSNLRQVDLARELGVAQTTIANYEQHSRFPDEKTLHEVADFFDVSLDYLLGRTEANVSMDRLRTEGQPVKELTPLARRYLDLLLRGRKSEAFEAVSESVRSGTPVRLIYRDVFEPVLKEVGRMWEISEVDVSQEHYISAATETLMGQLYPYLDRPDTTRGSVVAVAVGGELHEIGIRMVSDFLEEAGWDCYYLGINTPTDNVIRALRDRDADVLAISATMPYAIDSVRNMIRHIRNVDRDKRRQRQQIITGGQAFDLDPDLWKRIDADGYAASAEDAVRLVESLTNARAS